MHIVLILPILLYKGAEFFWGLFLTYWIDFEFGVHRNMVTASCLPGLASVLPNLSEAKVVSAPET